MRFRIPQNWLFDFSARLLREAGVEESDDAEGELENAVYEAGERNWEEYEDENGDVFYYIDW